MATKKVKDTVETVKTEAKEAAKKISKKAEPAVKAAKETVKAVSEKAEPAVKKAKTAAKTVSDKTKTAAKAAGAKAKTAAKTASKAAGDAAKTATKKVASVLTPEVFVEFGGAKFECSSVADRCKEDYKAKHPGERIRSCRVYIKPEDGMAYYVINELADKIEL